MQFRPSAHLRGSAACRLATSRLHDRSACGSSTAVFPNGKMECALGHREATAILSWRHSEVLYEKAPHRADVTEPGSRTDVLDWEIGLLEQSPRLVDPDATHEICGRLVEMSAAPAAERTRAHSNRVRETLHRQRLVEVLEDERVDVVVLGRDPFLAAECGAELRLTSRSSQK
jgi:hypothetical protein